MIKFHFILNKMDFKQNNTALTSKVAWLLYGKKNLDFGGTKMEGSKEFNEGLHR